MQSSYLGGLSTADSDYRVNETRQFARMLGLKSKNTAVRSPVSNGMLGMNNQSRGRTGNRLLPASLTDQALSIIREHYRDFGPTLAREKLEEVHGLVLGKETIRGRTLDSPQTTRTENSSASLPASLYWRADTN